MNEVLVEIQNYIKNIDIRSREDFEKVASYITDKKQFFVLAAQDSPEYYIYAILQQISLFIDDCRQQLLEDKLNYIIANSCIKKYVRKLLEENIDEPLEVVFLNKQESEN